MFEIYNFNAKSFTNILLIFLYLHNKKLGYFIVLYFVDISENQAEN